MYDENEPQTENFQELLNYLDQHRTQCEAEGRYVEAEMAKNRIEEVKH
jgi:hypothetical protein